MAAAAAIATATLGSAALQARSQGRAARGQQKSTAGAMRMQREERQAADKRYERDYSAWQAQQQQRNAILNAVLGKYGVNVGGGAPAGGASASPAGFQNSLGSLMGHGANAPDLFDSQGGTAGALPQFRGPAIGPATPTPAPAPAPGLAPFMRTGALSPVAPPTSPAATRYSGGSLSDLWR